MVLKGEFQITNWDENTLSEIGEQKVSHAEITQTYAGDLKATSSLNYIMSYLSSGYAKFVGIEWLDCEINNEKGRFAIQHDGEFNNGVASSKFHIIEDSASGSCKGFKGTGTFTSTEGGKANYHFELT